MNHRIEWNIILVLLVGFVSIFDARETSNAAPLTHLTCVVDTNLAACGSPAGTLRGSSGYSYVSVAGYEQPGDGGGGEFVASSCTPKTKGDTSNMTQLVTNVHSRAGIWVNEPVTGTGLHSGTLVSAVSPSSATITLSMTPISGAAGTDLIFTNADNGGTVINDSLSQCFYRTNYRGDPHEFGAYGGSGNMDDTAALQAWLLWTPGPWNATIPSNYQVNQPLTCWKNTVINGGTNRGLKLVANGTPDEPVVRIFAGSGFPNGPDAVITADDYCRISGIAIDANGQGPNLVDDVDVVGTTWPLTITPCLKTDTTT